MTWRKRDARHDVGQHKKKLAKQRADNDRLGQAVERAQNKRLRAPR